MRRFIAGAVQQALGNALWVAILGIPAAAAFIAARSGVRTIVWVAGAVLLAGAFGVGYLVGRGRHVGQARTHEAAADYFSNEVNRFAFYTAHIGDALNSLQRVVEGHVGDLTVLEFIQDGVVAPARDAMTQAPGEEIRISLLVPEEPARTDFVMMAAAGHRLESQRNFRMPIGESFAGIAYRSGEVVWSNDLAHDHRFTRHPKAAPGREYYSLISVPLHAEGRVVGVLNVLSTHAYAFTWPDLFYAGLLGTIIALSGSLGRIEPPTGPAATPADPSSDHPNG